MSAARIAPLLLSLSLPAWADDAAFDLDWEDGDVLRAVVVWELEVTSPDGEKTERSGVHRGLWSWEASDLGHVLVQRQPVKVRATPREDETSQQIAAALAADWRLELDATHRVPAEEAAVVGESTEIAVAAEAAVEASEDGTPAEAEAEAEAPAAEPMPAPPEPAEAPSGAEAVPEAGPPDLVELVDIDPEALWTRVFAGLDGATFTLGRPAFEDTDGGQLSRRVDALAYCPDEGPGSSCYELSMVLLSDGAPAEGLQLPAGAERVSEAWVVSPDVKPRDGRVEIVVAWADEDDAEKTWRARVVRDIRFLPAEPSRTLGQ